MSHIFAKRNVDLKFELIQYCCLRQAKRKMRAAAKALDTGKVAEVTKAAAKAKAKAKAQGLDGLRVRRSPRPKLDRVFPVMPSTPLAVAIRILRRRMRQSRLKWTWT